MTLEEYFKQHPCAALAFSGGADSAYLLYVAVKCGSYVRPYYVKTQFQPQFEFEDALRLTDELKVEMRVIEKDILSVPEVSSNPADRCYYCKRQIMGSILDAAVRDGFSLLMDGTNASDPVADRPGMRALTELQIQSPLRLCGLTKEKIREESRSAGLFTWNKPAYACLATRIPSGQTILAEDLARTEKAEEILSNLGFSDFRVRLRANKALLQITENQMPAVHEQWEKILQLLGPFYEAVELDQHPREKSL